MLVAAGNGGELAALGQAERKTQQQEHTDSQSTAKAESSDSQASTIVPSDTAASDTEASGRRLAATARVALVLRAVVKAATMKGSTVTHKLWALVNLAGPLHTLVPKVADTGLRH